MKITQGLIPSRIYLQGLMGPYGRLEYSHTGNRLDPLNDPPWVLFATTGAAEDAMKAISSGLVVDQSGVPIKAEWKSVSGKGKRKGDGKGKSKTEHMDVTSRDLFKLGLAGGGARGGDRGRRRRSSSSSSSSSRKKKRSKKK